ncbi:MAG: cation diffusion facilitator family transporter [Spirochaetia bacterium]|nr:cation diffusion facilitator family transporter [Spirochaetia bacterium]
MHDHHHSHHDHGHDEHVHLKNIGYAVALNFIFTIIEIFGALWTNSMAIFSDAIHDLGDTIILSFSYYSEKFANKTTDDENYTYGLSRLPLLSAFISSFVLLGGSVFILFTAIPRLFHPNDINVEGMMLLAILGVIINAGAILRLKNNEGLNSRVLALHLLEDVLGWVAVLIVSIVMHFYYLPILDPILSIGITLYILYRVLGNLKKSLLLFIQKAPLNINVHEIKKDILNMDEVYEICDFHIWSLDSIRHIFTIHIRIKQKLPEKKVSSIKDNIRKILKTHGSFHSTIEIEYFFEKCGDTC